MRYKTAVIDMIKAKVKKKGDTDEAKIAMAIINKRLDPAFNLLTPNKTRVR